MPVRRKLAPPLPVPTPGVLTDTDGNPAGPSAAPSVRPGADKRPNLPIKTLQGLGGKRTDGGPRVRGAPGASGKGDTSGGRGREWVRVGRQLGVGAYLGRCKGLILDEGYTYIVLFALSAAIPKALVLLHALLDVLPYPRSPRGVWYEIVTGSETCVDEVEPGVQKGTREGGEDDAVLDWLEGIGASTADEPKMVERIVIHIHIGPRAANVISGAPPVAPNKTPESKPGEGRARPSKRKRQAMAAKRAGVEKGRGDPEADEEALMNGAEEGVGHHTSDEEVEQVEMR